MTGHRPDQPGNQNPSDSASQDAGADVSADEFAAALKVIVKRLDGQDDEAETPPAGRDSDSDSAAVPPTAVLNSASQPALNEPLWTGLSDSDSGEPEATSPLAGGANAVPDATRDASFSEGGSTAGSTVGSTTAGDLWPTNSPSGDDASISGDEPVVADDPLLAGTPAREKEPLFSEPPSEIQPSMPPPATEGPSGSGSNDEPLFAPASDSAGRDSDPLFVDTSPSDDPLSAETSPPRIKEPLFVETPTSPGAEDPLFTESSPPPVKEPLFDETPSEGGGDPLFNESSKPAAKEPLFVETSSDDGQEPLLAKKPPPSELDPFKVESMIGSGAYGQPKSPSAEEPDASSASDPLAALRNRGDGPTIGPAMPEPGPQPPSSPPPEPQAPEPPAMDAVYGDDPTGRFSDSAPGLDYPEPAGGGAAAPESTAAETPPAADPATTPGDPFAAASRPAFEDESASALFGDAPTLAEQHAPGSSLGPIGAESENFEKDRAARPGDDALFGQSAKDAEAKSKSDLTANRELGDDSDSDVELDQILPPLDPEAGTLEKVASPPRPRRPLRVGAAAFWLLILAILGGVGYWGFEVRHQSAALFAWAQDQYGFPGGQLAALLERVSGPASSTSPAEGVPESSTPSPDVAALPTAADPAPAVAVEPAPPPSPAPQPAAAEPAPAPVAAARPAPPVSPAPASTAPAAVETAAATSRLPDHLAPLPADVSPQIRALADQALAGDPLAQHDLANQYAIGDTVPQNNSYAAHWYRLASEAGIVNAQYNLGVLTTRGLGVRKDVEDAFQLFKDAAEAGHADAQTALGLAYMHGIGVRQDRMQAASWFQAASANGRPRGAFHLGQLFELGLDESPDLAAAAGWYRIAADGGYVQAREALDRLTVAIRPTPAPTPSTTVTAPATTPTPVPPSPEPIPTAAPSELVREIQQLLNQFGYNAGTEDGRLGQQTVEAIRAFQRSQSLYVTGEASPGLRLLLQGIDSAR